jgi:PAS domain S-box-containing protein
VNEGDFASLFNFLPIGAFRSTSAGRMVRANPALVAINGYASEAQMLDVVNAVNADWYVQPTRRNEFLEALRRDGFVRGFISEIRRHGDGAHLWISENTHEVRDEQGLVAYFEGTVEDITERVQAQQALERSEEQLRLITSQIPGMVFVLHLDPQGKGTYRYLSPGVRDIYGLEPDALLRDAGLTVRYRHPDDMALRDEDLRRVTSGESVLGGEFRIVLPSGQVKWILRRSTAVSSDAQGQLRVGVLLDITARKQAEAALSESEALWKLALEGTGDGVWDWNLETGEEYISERIKTMFGYGANDVMATAADIDRLTHREDIPKMRLDRQAHLEGRTPVYRNEHRMRCKDGSWKWVLSRGMVIQRDEDGKPLRMVGTHTDITDLKRAETQQQALESQLREAQKLEAIGTLAGGVAHDFNNLLAVILGNLTLAREDVGKDHVALESLDEIGRASVRARHLVQQILAFSRRQAQELKHLPLRPLVEETLKSMRSLLPAGVQQATDFADPALLVLADGTQVQQVLMNLCTNAWQAMEGSTGNITVGLHTVAVGTEQAHRLGGIPLGDYACLSVTDTGPGMDVATQQRIFEPFFTTKAPGSGTGLGLAVVHGIVKAHRGGIEVHSELGVGTRFDVFLPLSSAAPVDEVGVDGGPAVSPAAMNPNGRHVVYIDDYEAMVFLVGRLLRKAGYQVSTFTSGEDALAWIRSEAGALDLVVSDHNMPGMSGVEVAAELQRLRPGLRTVLISGHVNDQLLAQAAAVGVLDVMPKQDNMAALGESIRQMLDAVVIGGAGR